MERIFIDTEFITLGQFLKFSGTITNGSEAKMYLQMTQITVNNELENRRGRKLYPGYEVKIGKKAFLICKK